jgi:MFS family permease
MNGARVGALIGLVGGLLFVVVNGFVLPTPWSGVVIGIALLVALLATRTVLRTAPDPEAYRPDSRQMQAFWITIGLEVAALVGGGLVLNQVLHVPEASLPWVSLVLGLHWLVFKTVFQQDVFLWLGWFTLTLGIVGMIAALSKIGPPESPVVVSGLLTGLVMIGAVAVDGRRRRQRRLGLR